MNKNFFIIIHGPTGVGKTDFILNLGKHFPIEIINCDVGQMYEPVAIGTAKPDWKNQPIPHHLFDTITIPENWSVMQYRQEVQKKLLEVFSRQAIPVLVGGSGFYGKSLFFPPLTGEGENVVEVEGTWDDLAAHDPERAAQIHRNDTYRINRALSIIASTSVCASEKKPQYDPLGTNFLVVYLHKDRATIYEQINQRTEKMIENGWIEEVKKLQGTLWEPFLKQKKLIGYPELFEYLEGDVDKKIMIQTIQKKTRNYAKRQDTFWRMFKKALLPYTSTDQLVECDLSKKEDIEKLRNMIEKKV